MELVIASTNMHKIREFRAMLKPLKHLDVRSLLDFPSYTPPPEKEESFEENAKSKAEHAAITLGRYALADDSGLVVPALHGKPGILSARYAGDNASDRENRKKLLSEMLHLQDAERYAYFICCLTLAAPDGSSKSVQAICEGLITETEQGRNGFGYDSIFMKHEYRKTFAELEEDTKNRISHRRKAFDKMAVFLESLSV